MSEQTVTLVRCDCCGHWEVRQRADPRQFAAWLRWWSVVDEHQVVPVHVCPRCQEHPDLVARVRSQLPPQE